MVCLCHKTEIYPDKFFELFRYYTLSDLSSGYKANICILTHFYSYITRLLWLRIQYPAYWYKNNKYFISIPSEHLKGANSTIFLCIAQVTHTALEHQNR